MTGSFIGCVDGLTRGPPTRISTMLGWTSRTTSATVFARAVGTAGFGFSHPEATTSNASAKAGHRISTSRMGPSLSGRGAAPAWGQPRASEGVPKDRFVIFRVDQLALD